ncbi:hypothetical protein RHMOL_Rhmol11G0050200 [Rhododendron molle]|uniref:Uncharacterized protein n=1 Tax=Rhododendron molle TaxID=49168 RepID=A0ACC0LPS8_RHOML|nr:hypothetical protein RHMOL_Rhmol11G0050200 [Rhododendron molle]
MGKTRCEAPPHWWAEWRLSSFPLLVLSQATKPVTNEPTEAISAIHGDPRHLPSQAVGMIRAPKCQADRSS